MDERAEWASVNVVSHTTAQADQIVFPLEHDVAGRAVEIAVKATL